MAAEQGKRTAKEELIQLILESNAEDLKLIADALTAFLEQEENKRQ